MPGETCLWAWALERSGELGNQRPPRRALAADDGFVMPAQSAGVAGHTTIAAVATNAALTKAEAQRIAIMAQDGFARAIRPAHTPFDGDTVFALAMGEHALGEPRAVALARLGALAADCIARAVARGVYEAETLGTFTGYREWRRAR
jgi:L-aminopeptidase/D-esterase-like protein